MNPEFERNLWLEADPRRLAWTGVALAALYGAVVLLARNHAVTALGVAGAFVFMIAGVGWGSRQAGRAVGDEVAERTWDFQRLSALTPWAMTWGKLFGATSLSWLAALSGLVLAVAAAAESRGLDAALQVVLIGLSAALLLQAGSMAMALVGVRRARLEGRNAAFRVTFGGLIGLLIVASAAGRGLRIGGGPLGWLMTGVHGVDWWGLALPMGWFAALSLAAFAAWALVAAWRLMRLELQMENFPWAWPLGVLFTGLWTAGLSNTPAGAFAAAGAVFAASAYAAAFAEPADPVRLKRFTGALTGGDLHTAIYTAPAAIASVKLAVLAVVGVALTSRGFGAPSGSLAFSALAFVLRDLGIIAFFRFGPRPGRGDFGAVVGLFLAYFVGGIVGGSMGGETGRALFTPASSVVAIVSGAVQAVAIWTLAWGRIRGGRSVAVATP